MIVAPLLSAFLACQPAAPSGSTGSELETTTRDWFVARRLAEDGKPGVTEADVAWHRRRVHAVWGRAACEPGFLRDAPRLMALFRRSLDYAPAAGTGAFEPWDSGEGVAVRVPVAYAPGTAWPTLVSVYDAAEETSDAATARAASIVDDAWLVVAVDARRLVSFLRAPLRPRLTSLQALGFAGSALAWAVGPVHLATRWWRVTLDASRVDETVDERDLPRGLFALLGGVQRRLHIDRERLVLLCSGSAVQVGVRAAATAPDRFAGLLLWAPARVPTGLLENLALVPILVVGEGTFDLAAETIAALTRTPGGVVRRDAWPGGRAEITTWVRGATRDLFRRRLGFTMEDDAIVDGFWLRVLVADFGGARGGRRARIDATVDRATNTISVSAQHIDELTLLLSDAIVDLDRAVVVEINGVPATLRRARSADFLLESVFQRFDPGYLFTTAITLAVPRRG